MSPLFMSFRKHNFKSKKLFLLELFKEFFFLSLTMNVSHTLLIYIMMNDMIDFPLLARTSGADTYFEYFF